MQQKKYQIITMRSVMIKHEDSNELRLAPFSPGWFVPLFPVVFCILISAIILLYLPQNYIAAIFILGFAAVILYGNPVQNDLTIHFISRHMQYRAVYWLRWPARVEFDLPLSQIISINRGNESSYKSNRVDLTMVDGSRLTLDFNNRREDVGRLVSRLQANIKQQEGYIPDPGLSDNVNNTAIPEMPASALSENEIHYTRQRMVSNLKNWSIWLILSGTAQFITEGKFSIWGLEIILVGLGAFYFNEAPMAITFSVIMAQAGINNLFFGEILWKGIAALQFFWTFQLISMYRRVRKIENKSQDSTLAAKGAERSKKWFPWLSLGFGAFSFFGFLAVVVGILISVIIFHAKSPPIFPVLINICFSLSTLGLAFGLAGWVGAFPKKWALIIGSVLSLLTLAIEYISLLNR